MPKLRSRTTIDGRNMAGARALWRATGLTNEDLVCTITEDAITTRDPGEYDSRYKKLEKRYQKEEQERQAINYQIADLTTRPAQPSLVRD